MWQMAEGQDMLVAQIAAARLTELPDDTPTRELVDKAIDGALTEWFCTPPQVLLGAGVSAAIDWLKKRNRHDDASWLQWEAQCLFALMNDPQKLHGLMLQIGEDDNIVTVGLKPAWEEACKRNNRDPTTGQEVRGGTQKQG